MIQDPNEKNINGYLKANRGVIAMKAANQIALENGTAEMTLDEINEEISNARNGLNT